MLDNFLYSEQNPLLFTHAMFWVFFGAIIVAMQFFYKNNRSRNLFLLWFSLYFYYLSSGVYFLLLLFSTVVDYYVGKKIYATEVQSHRKAWLVSSLVVNLLLLGYFKYSYFVADIFSSMLGTLVQPTNVLAWVGNLFTPGKFDENNIFLPVGISFYTFQTISYSVDIYRRQLKPVNDIWDFAFYVSFFPQLVAGPIVRASDFVPQIYQRFRLTQEEYGSAMFLIANGLVKKIIISDYISINFVDRVFQAPGTFSGFENLMAVYGYAIQIYCDFSGYTDIAIGVSLLLGFRLAKNFDSPYKASNITDFWRRWHISLSSWLRDYLYIPMGGNRKGESRTYLHLLATMLLGGLWHGAHWRFLIWGALHGVALSLHKLWLSFVPASTKANPVNDAFARVLTFQFVCFCWVFFRAESLDSAWVMLIQITTEMRPEVIPQVVDAYGVVFFVMILGYVGHWLPAELKLKAKTILVYSPDFLKAAFMVALALLLFQMKSTEIQPFIYFQF